MFIKVNTHTQQMQEPRVNSRSTEQDVAQRLRDLRVARGLSQRELARRSGVANATISQIEAGKHNPTVSMLKRLLDGIPVSLGDFFADDLLPPEQIFFRAGELTEIADGGVSYRQVGTGLRGRALQLLHERYQPGAGTGGHSLHHEGEEAGIVLRGRLQVTVGDERTVLGPGDAYYFQSSVPHRFRNAGNEVCELISVCTPPSF